MLGKTLFTVIEILSIFVLGAVVGAGIRTLIYGFTSGMIASTSRQSEYSREWQM